MRRFDGKSVLVTGATGGIGQAIVRRFADEGAQVIITDVDQDECDRLSVQSYGNHFARRLDVTDEQSWSDLVGEIEAELGGLYGLVNNAALATPGSVTDESMDAWNKVIAVGQTGTWLGMKHAGALIERSGGGSIVNICSILGTVGVAHSFAYHAAKGAVRGMSKSAAIHWARAGVRVNSLHPGYIGTPRMLDRLDDSAFAEVTVGKTPMGRLGTSEEVADAVAFIASPGAGFMTGAELYIDGGLTAQ
ncbi:SDR family NAD(P)-dependent oxidoreductase [Rhodococcus qingshengii]|uniref:SDR family NAD(P)-dependent oxidoreductase n=1 Tax=Rhodococcus qingshengii TaxID=334542 RepID=UPI0010A63D2F|nr:SDR family oxidoreductase [Rhodococcus qingshengii]THJ67612.1 SDR family oxidoreductase [Rhodococcus qingshengii]